MSAPRNRVPATRRIAIPDGLAAYMADHTQEDAAEYYGVALCTVTSWCKEIGFRRERPISQGRYAPPPAWWVRDASGLTRDEAMIRAGVGKTVVNRWVRETGVACKPHVNISPGKRRVAPARPVDVSVAGSAQSWLQSRGYTVYRCNDVGAQSIGGRFWRCDRAILDTDALVAKARDKGFDPDAWKRIAA